MIIPNGVNRPEVVDDDLITKRFDLHKNEYFLFLGRACAGERNQVSGRSV